MQPVIDGVEMVRAAFDIEVKPNGLEGQNVSLSFSSEEPYLRDNGWEILGHQPGEVDLTRLVSGTAPLLKDHRRDLDSMIGHVESAQISGGRGQAVVRFSSTPEGKNMLARVRAGEVKSVSVGYQIQDYVRSGERDGVPVNRVTRWRPFEISLVAVAADATVGVGRSVGGAGNPYPKSKVKNMTTETTAAPTGGANRAVAEERRRCAEIRAIARRFNVPEADVDDAIENGTSEDKFRGIVMDHLSAEEAPATRSGETRIGGGFNRTQERTYSLSRAINAHLTRDFSEAGFEREVASEMQRAMGRAPQGFFVPDVVLSGQRDLLTTTNAAAMIGTHHAGNAFIDALTPEVKVMSLGATVLQGLRENVSIPRMPSGTSAEWVAENASATESTPTFDSVSLTLRQLSASTRISRRQAKQALPGLDVILQNDLRRQIAVSLNSAAINGAGSATEPRGILNTTGVSLVDRDPATGGGTPGSLTWRSVTRLMAAVEMANAPMASMGFLTNYNVKAAMLRTGKLLGDQTDAILNSPGDGKSVAGLPIAFTSLVPSDLTEGAETDLSALIFGSWSDLLIGSWGGIDIILDELTEARQGNVRIVAHSEWDIAIRNPESFAIMTDIVTAD